MNLGLSLSLEQKLERRMWLFDFWVLSDAESFSREVDQVLSLNLANKNMNSFSSTILNNKKKYPKKKTDNQKSKLLKNY